MGARLVREGGGKVMATPGRCRPECRAPPFLSLLSQSVTVQDMIQTQVRRKKNKRLNIPSILVPRFWSLGLKVSPLLPLAFVLVVTHISIFLILGYNSSLNCRH